MISSLSFPQLRSALRAHGSAAGQSLASSHGYCAFEILGDRPTPARRKDERRSLALRRLSGVCREVARACRYFVNVGPALGSQRWGEKRVVGGVAIENLKNINGRHQMTPGSAKIT